MSSQSNSTTRSFDHDFSHLITLARRFRRHRLGMIGVGLTALYFIIALVGPLVIVHDPLATEPMNRFLGPSGANWLGTDRYGRDVFTRTIYGARLSLMVAVIVSGGATVVGVTLGLIAGFYRGKIDEIIMRGIDIAFAFPSILLALVIVAILGPGLWNATLALTIAFIPPMTRITRGSALSVREEEYVLASSATGESNLNIMFREMLPNLFSAVFVQLTITFAYAIIAEAGLSYLGLSAQSPTPTWGAIISEGQNTLMIAPWVSLFPGLTIMLTVLGLTFVGVGLRDTLDPTVKQFEGSGGL